MIYNHFCAIQFLLLIFLDLFIYLWGEMNILDVPVVW